jgi:hypothetical protein
MGDLNALIAASASWGSELVALLVPAVCLLAACRRQTARIAALRNAGAKEFRYFTMGGALCLAMICHLIYSVHWPHFTAFHVGLVLLILNFAHFEELLCMLAAFFLLGSASVGGGDPAVQPFLLGAIGDQIWLVVIGGLVLAPAALARLRAQRRGEIAQDRAPGWQSRALGYLMGVAPIAVFAVLAPIFSAAAVHGSHILQALPQGLILGAGLLALLEGLSGFERWLCAQSERRRSNLEVSTGVVVIATIVGWTVFVTQHREPAALVGYMVVAGALLSDPALALRPPPRARQQQSDAAAEAAVFE